jgi:hypothetical protein
MKNFFRIILVTFVWLSLLVVPYSLIAWACYAGLCGGGDNAEIGIKYGAFFPIFSIVYLFITILCISLYYFNRRFRRSIIILLIPVIALLPFVYVQFKISQIEDKYHIAALMHRS